MDEIYTLGSRKDYKEYLEKYGDEAKKIGPRPPKENSSWGNQPYGGGIAFASVPAALLWAKAQGKTSWVPFLLEGNWQEDVYWDHESVHYRIKRDLKIIKEVT